MSEDIRALLERVQQGETSVEEALLAIKKAPYEDIDYAKIDLRPGDAAFARVCSNHSAET